jgi:hypothetical protein
MQCISYLLLLLFFFLDFRLQGVNWLVVSNLESSHSLWLKSNSLETVLVLNKSVKIGLFVFYGDPFLSLLAIQRIDAL